MQSIETSGSKQQSPLDVHTASSEKFRTAAESFGGYCPVKNELRVRKGRKTYRFTLGRGVIHCEAPDLPEVVCPFSPDVTVGEFKRFIASLTNAR